MSQPTRTARRHGTHHAPTPKGQRDPMTAVYIGIGVAIVLIFAAFGIFNWKTTTDLNAKLAIANATPTPGPNAKAKAVQIVDGIGIGKPAFARGDNPDAGNGQPVHGVKCETAEGVTLHVHAHLTLFVKGVQLQVPANIGFPQTGACLYWTHTHDASGLIHVEAPDFTAPDGGPYTLGLLFDIWGETLTKTQVARYVGPLTAYVNGTKYDGDLKAIPLTAHQQITLEVGKPLVPPPNYTFPPNE
ncbi:MAG: hypothetical protein M3R30_07755 [Candidatus Eremiobacteraeota bacterium]|nr:hypothetical protein [Candidatus Eremiobacteraeota bacterium]